MHRNVDPRKMITPQSFAVAPDLLGIPLAGSRRRFAAIVLDLFFLAFFLALVKAAAGVFFALTVSVILLRITTGPGQGHVVARWGKRGLRFAAAVLIFWGALEIWQAGSDALESEEPAAAEVDDRGAEDEAPAAVLVDAERWSDTVAVAYAQALRAGDDAARAAMLPRLREEIAGDTIDELIGSNRKLERTIASLEEDRSLVSLLKEMIDRLGIGFGWSALYFTAFLTLGGGQTPGKRMMGIRVIRLNGKTMSWWIAFERFGGYSASLVTGLLGFAQIMWDRNRQALHDKLAETVVVRDVRSPRAPQPAAAAAAPAVAATGRAPD